MKKIKSFVALAVVSLAFSSCTITYHSVNSNPIGDKVGQSSGLDFSIRSAALDGNVDQISTTEIRFGVFSTAKTTVGGK